MCFLPIDVIPSPIVDMSSLPIDLLFFPLCVPNYVSLPYQQYVLLFALYVSMIGVCPDLIVLGD